MPPPSTTPVSPAARRCGHGLAGQSPAESKGNELAPDSAPIRETVRDYHAIPTRQLSCDGDGPTVVLLHGVYDRADTWLRVLECMARGGRRAVAVDLPPIHLRAAGEPILPALDAFVAAVVGAHAGEDGVVLAGNSMGAGLTLRAALDPSLPIRVGVPIDIPGFGYRPLVRVTFGPYGPSEALLARIRLPRAMFGLRPAHSYTRRMLHYRGRASDPEHVRYFLDLFAAADPLGALAAAGRALLGEFDAGYPPGTPAPLLFVHGRGDKLIPFTAAYRAAATYPGATVRILDTCGHCPQLDEPQLLADLILDFDDTAHRPHLDRAL
ncbi:alpha/beta hydrolase [Nocardia cyriacigeorgica]|nr:alpha/beta hydrolase [Nocardia cyriacigeorgica]